jgi:hypothetical protein
MSDMTGDLTALLMTKPVTRIHGRPERNQIDVLEKEVARIVSSTKTTRFPQGNKYGHLVMIVGETAYKNIIGDATFIFTIPTDAGAYDTVTIVDTIASNAAAKAQAEAVHKRRQGEYYKWTAVESAARQLIVGAIDDELLVELVDEWVQYEGHTPAAIIQFLRDHVCLPATTEDQLALQAKLIEPWDQTENLLSYFKKLDLAQDAMKKAHVPCEDTAKAIQAGAQMAASGMFNELQIIEWEEKSHTDKTWANLKTYYSKLYKSKIQYSKSEARRTGFESAQALQQAKDRAVETQLETFMESVSTAHSDEINEIRADNKALTDLTAQFMSQMKTQQKVLDKMAQQLDDSKKLTERPAATDRGPQRERNDRGPQRERHECPTCKIMCFHKKENCPETNEAKRWPGWTTRL